MHPRSTRSMVGARATSALLGAVLATTLAVVGMVCSGLVAHAAARSTATDDGAATWSVATASNHFGGARRNYAYVSNPGGRIEDAIVVSNRGVAPISLRLYAADGYTTPSGTLDLRTQDAASTTIGAWVTPAQREVTISPGASVTVPFTVVVPKDARPGDHLGGIVASRTEPSAAGSGGADVERRVGLRIQLRVGGAFQPRFAVENLRVTYAGTANPFGKGSALVTYTIHNTGNAVLRARQSVGIAGPLGQWTVRGGAVPDSPALLPGETWAVTVPVRGVAPTVGTTATVTLTPLLTDPAGSTAPLAPAEATAPGWAVPWALLLLVAVLVGPAVMAARLRRRRLEGAIDAEQPATSPIEPDRELVDQSP